MDDYFEWWLYAALAAVLVVACVFAGKCDAESRRKCERARCPDGMEPIYSHPYKSASQCICGAKPVFTESP